MNPGDGKHDEQALFFDCEMCQALLSEAVEETLNEEEQGAFERHLAGCAACAETMGAAQRGLSWLTLLKEHPPEPPAALLDRILAGTVGLDQGALEPAYAGKIIQQPAWRPVPAPGFSQRLRRWWSGWSPAGATGFHGLQPRLTMTAAMAFVSVTLTLNLMGVSLRSMADLRLQDLRPATMRMAAEAQAAVVRRVEGNPMVDRFESQVEDLRSWTGIAQQVTPSQQ